MPSVGAVDFAFDKLENFARVQRSDPKVEAFELFLTSVGLEGDSADQFWKRMGAHRRRLGETAIACIGLGLSLGLAMREYELEHAECE